MITGAGAFTAAGRTAADLWSGVQAGASLARWNDQGEEFEGNRFATCSAPPTGPEIDALHRLGRMDRSVQMAGVAAWEAWQDAALPRDLLHPERVAIFAGTSRGPLESVMLAHRRVLARKRMLPTLAPNSTISCLSGALSNLFAVRGPCLTISAACASGAAAIGMAAQQIAAGFLDVAVAGGAEAPLNSLVLSQLESAGVLASHSDPQSACRPFDSERNGTVLGEGAAFLILESVSRARQRGARIRARLAGWAVTSDGGGRTGISRENEGLERAMRGAVEMAGMSFDEIDYINAHGTGTRLNDRLEARAIATAAKGRAIPTSSTKPVTGHCMGAASAIEAVISILAIENQCLPPSANCHSQDPDCPVKLVTGQPWKQKVRAVLSNSAGFWGNTAALVFTTPGKDES
ncbi:MAG: beta-ketoacyl-[acyl-carrier-protein] synthase family protein [Chthoniobacterales bacterium]